MVIKTVGFGCMDRKIAQWNRIESPETNSYISDKKNPLYEKLALKINWEKVDHLTNDIETNGYSCGKKFDLHHTCTSSKWVQDFKLKRENSNIFREKFLLTLGVGKDFLDKIEKGQTS